MDVRRFIIIFVIAILYAIFVNSLIEAVYPEPDHSSCYDNPRHMKLAPDQQQNCPEVTYDQVAASACRKEKGQYQAVYEGSPCIKSYECSYCQRDLNQLRAKHNLVTFIISALFGLIAILVGLYLPTTNPLNEWVGFGFILGGLFSIFAGTAQYYQDMARIARPIVMLAELIIVLVVTYKKIQLGKSSSKKKKN